MSLDCSGFDKDISGSSVIISIVDTHPLVCSGQMGRSRMKSDNTTLSAGYASVLGFNLRQLKRYATGVVRPKIAKTYRLCTIEL